MCRKLFLLEREGERVKLTKSRDREDALGCYMTDERRKESAFERKTAGRIACETRPAMHLSVAEKFSKQSSV